MPSLRPRFWNELNAIIKKNNGYKVDGSTASYETKAKRSENIHAGFRYLASCVFCPTVITHSDSS